MPAKQLPRPDGETARSRAVASLWELVGCDDVCRLFWPTRVDIGLRADWDPSHEALKPLVAGRRVDGAGFDLYKAEDYIRDYSQFRTPVAAP